MAKIVEFPKAIIDLINETEDYLIDVLGNEDIREPINAFKKVGHSN